jgi:putative ABC transport system permease protein
MKLKDIILTANANMLRSKLRTVLTIIAIVIGSFTLTLTNGIGSGISTYIDKQIDNLGASNVLLITAKTPSTMTTGPQKYDPGKTLGRAERGPDDVTFLTSSDIKTLQANPKLSNVIPTRVVSPAYIVGQNRTKYQLTLSNGIPGSNLDLATGSNVNDTATTNQIVLPVDYVTTLGYSSYQAAIGQTVTIGVADAYGTIHEVMATISGVQNKGLIGSSGATFNETLTKLVYADQSIGLPTAATLTYNSATATFKSNLSNQQVTQLKSTLSSEGYSAQTVKDTIGVFKSVISAIVYVLDGFAVIALLAAGFGIVNTLLMSVQERTKEIGLMKAMGMRSSRIFLLFSFEAILIGFWGSLIGIGFAELIGRLANHVVSHGILKDLPSFTLLSFPALTIVKIMLLIMVIAFLAGSLPARRAAKQNPIDALRYE